MRKTINAHDWEAAQTQEAELPQVQVTGLPSHLCSEKMLNAMIDQTGWMSQCVRNFVASRGNHPNDPGKVLLWLENYEAACWVSEYFNNGVRWAGCELNAEITSRGTAEACPSWDMPRETWPEWETAFSVDDIPPLPGAEDLVPADLWDDLEEEDTVLHCRTDTTSSAMSQASAWLEEATLCLKQEKSSRPGSDASTCDEESGSGDKLSEVGSACSPGQ